MPGGDVPVQEWDPEKRLPTCPHAERVAGLTPEMSGCVCGVMRHDQGRADSILEGAPVGVFISVRDDFSTWSNFCTGLGAPVSGPDDPVIRERPFGFLHYTACPIAAAAREIETAERLFAAPERPKIASEHVRPEPVTDEDMAVLTGDARGVA